MPSFGGSIILIFSSFIFRKYYTKNLLVIIFLSFLKFDVFQSQTLLPDTYL